MNLNFKNQNLPIVHHIKMMVLIYLFKASLLLRWESDKKV
jgi:hypothetical protein